MGIDSLGLALKDDKSRTEFQCVLNCYYSAVVVATNSIILVGCSLLLIYVQMEKLFEKCWSFEIVEAAE